MFWNWAMFDSVEFLAHGIATHRHLTEVDSTNLYALQVAEEICGTEMAATQLPMLVTCERQNAGRGRGTNRWDHSSGNLAFTILCPIPRNVPPQWLSIWTGVCLLRLSQEYLPGENCELKWPNDLWINGCKNAGILIESAKNLAAVGIGLNLQRPAAPLTSGPANDNQTEPERIFWSDLNSSDLAPGSNVSGSNVSGGNRPAIDAPSVLLRLMQLWLPQAFGCQAERASLRQEFQAHDALKGREISLQSERQAFRGRYEGLDENGFLRLRLSRDQILGCDQIRVFPTADRIRILE